ncbi:MAG: hypothetical protein ACREQY_10530 [Candidatus Binatia bacterium]
MEGSIVVSAIETLQGVFAEWQLIVAGTAALSLLLLTYAVWLLRDLRAELRHLPSELEHVAREPAEMLHIAAVHLEDISQKLGKIIPPNFHVRSIRADNLVVRPGGTDGRASRRVAESGGFERW